ncbi:unnamed protein product [Rotaria socialis]|uniref:tRNA (32-2'-O)-methyltransferase regulator THADA-like TPR repeats region domain-containing protein n=1 Tax=Rotaria socialis TaxID=392032 RepID=A0A821BTE7_9BILA|nr:unnamed protein product [Rotaria socialis]
MNSCFEEIPNELILYIFCTYFDGIQLYKNFFELNSRFNTLIKSINNIHLRLEYQDNDKSLDLFSSKAISLYIADPTIIQIVNLLKIGKTIEHISIIWSNPYLINEMSARSFHELIFSANSSENLRSCRFYLPKSHCLYLEPKQCILPLLHSIYVQISIPSVDCRRTIRLCPNLVRLEIEIIDNIDNQEERITVVSHCQHANIRRFHIYNLLSLDVFDILMGYLPNLANLYISMRLSSHPMDVFEQLSNYFQRMPSRSKKILSPIPLIPNDEQNVTDLIRQSQSVFSSSNQNDIQALCEQLIDILIISSSTDPPNTSLRKCVVKGFSYLQTNQYDNVVNQCTKRLEVFFKRQGKQHRIEYISMLNYLIENFPFGLVCVFNIKDTISNQLISIGEEIWSDIQLTNVPHHRFNLFQQLQYYLKVVVFLLPKFHDELESDGIISRIIHEMLNDENRVTLEIRLTCSLVWHLLKENEQLSPDEKVDKMKKVTCVTMSRLALYFGLIKTTIINQYLDTNFFVRLLEEVLAFKTRDATIMVGISKALETYSEALNSSWHNLHIASLENIIDKLLAFAWDHFSFNVETVRHCSTNIYSNTFKISMNHNDLRQSIIDSQLTLLKQLPWQKDGCSLAYHTLLEYVSVSDILKWNLKLAESCLMAMNDRGLASEASYLYCVLCHKHREEEKSTEIWKQTWLKPVVDALDTSTPLHRSLIAEYILPKILKGHPEYLQDLKEITVNPRTLIVCTRIGRTLGLCPNLFSSCPFIEHDLIRQGITSEDEQICLDCLFILCENPKTTEYLSKIEFELIKYFLQMNVDNGSTSFRNQVLSLLKKHFIRVKDSWLFCARQKLKKKDQDFDDLTERYRNYLNWLINWSCSNLYLEGSYSQRHLSILILHWLIHLHGNQGVETICRKLFSLFSVLFL